MLKSKTLRKLERKFRNYRYEVQCFNNANNFIINFLLLILIFSSFILPYDQEKVIALCLFCFPTLIYWNFKDTIFFFLAEKTITLESEFLVFFKDRLRITRKIRSLWRIFLDIDDFSIDMYRWIKISLIKKKNLKDGTRAFFPSFFFKKNLNYQFINFLITNFHYQIWALKEIFFNLNYFLKFNIKYNLLLNKLTQILNTIPLVSNQIDLKLKLNNIYFNKYYYTFIVRTLNG